MGDKSAAVMGDNEPGRSPFESATGGEGEVETEAQTGESLKGDTTDEGVTPHRPSASDDGRLATFSTLLEDPEEHLVFRRGKGEHAIRGNRAC